MITRDEYESAIKKRDESEEVIRVYHQEQATIFNKRMEENPIFTLDELIYSAFTKCKGCGSGLAYPRNCGPNHYWDCGDVLLGKIKNPGKEHAQFPFMYFEIKSEQQPSANGATTRPQ